MQVLDQYKKLEKVVLDFSYIHQAMLDEDFVPPHKQAGFVPYDAVLLADDISEENSLTKELVEEILTGYGVEYDSVLSVENHDMYYDCKYIVYISLV